MTWPQFWLSVWLVLFVLALVIVLRTVRGFLMGVFSLPDRPAEVEPDEIERQRSLGWPDFHPEDYCHRCGKAIPVWHADSELWFTAFPEARGSDGGGIMCPSCFAFAYEQATGTTPIWRFSILTADPQKDENR